MGGGCFIPKRPGGEAAATVGAKRLGKKRVARERKEKRFR